MHLIMESRLGAIGLAYEEWPLAVEFGKQVSTVP